MLLFRSLAVVSMMVLVSVAAAGCGAGLSKEDADARCDQDKASLSHMYSDEAYAQCEACYMECGDSCVRTTTTSVIGYACEDSAGSGGASTTSSK